VKWDILLIYNICYIYLLFIRNPLTQYFVECSDMPMPSVSSSQWGLRMAVLARNPDPAQTKIAIWLYTTELSAGREWRKIDYRHRIVCLHPGWLQRRMGSQRMCPVCLTSIEWHRNGIERVEPPNTILLLSYVNNTWSLCGMRIGLRFKTQTRVLSTKA